MEKLVGGQVTFVRIPHSGKPKHPFNPNLDYLILPGINICLGVLLTDLDEPGKDPDKLIKSFLGQISS